MSTYFVNISPFSSVTLSIIFELALLCFFPLFFYPLDPRTHLCCTGFLLLEQYYFYFDLVALALGSDTKAESVPFSLPYNSASVFLL